jgi:hypothetical protein
MPGIELALYWFGAALMIAIMTWAFFAFGRRTLFASGHYEESGVVAAGILALASAAAILYRRKGQLVAVETAIYWFGCSLAAGSAVVAWSLALEFLPAGPGREAPSFFIAAVAVIASAFVIVKRGRMPVGGTAIAIYWAGCSIALAFVALAIYIWTRAGEPLLQTVTALIILGVAARLITSRKERLEGLETLIYWFGCSAASVFLAVFPLRIVGVTQAAAFWIAATAALVVGGVIVIRRGRTMRQPPSKAL